MIKYNRRINKQRFVYRAFINNNNNYNHRYNSNRVQPRRGSN